MVGQKSAESGFWKNTIKALLPASVVFNILIISYVGGVLARRFGAFEDNRPIAAKERAKNGKHKISWPKRNESFSVLSFEQIEKNIEVHPQARWLIAEAVKKEYPLDWNFTLNYRPADSSFFYLAELASERCDCEGDPFAKTGLRLFLNPYEGGVFFVDTFSSVANELAVKD